jgi:ubiquinone/menaquinone biosynthesis C-methylase UbiE
MLPRVLEPEVMDTPEEARDYDAMDHASVNARFCDDLLWFANRGGRSALARDAARVIDFGTGTAQIPIALCSRAAGFSVVAIDLAENMLALARTNVARAGLDDRIRLVKVDAKGTSFEDGAFGACISNSIIHHIPEPAQGFAEMWRVTAPGGLLFVRDLHRPESDAAVDQLVALYGGSPPADPALVASFEHQRSLFRASLCAALTVAEIAALVAPLGVPASAITMTSDRHWTLAYEKP